MSPRPGAAGPPRRAAERGDANRAAGPGAPEALPWRSPAFLAVACAAFASILLSVSVPAGDPDLWQHLAVGRWVWTRHALPVVHEWTWPLWGTRDVNPSWGFETLLWPFWDRAGLAGLRAWQWITTAVAFAFLWAAARRAGARGLAPALVLALAALTWRKRADLRPESLSAVLLALSFWILETRRSGGPDRSPWLVAIAGVWANSHVSYFLGLLVTALYLCDDLLARRRGEARPARPLLVVALASVAVSLLNPSGWRALAQPFEYALVWRHQEAFRTIAELAPPRWEHNWRNGLPLFVAGWPLLAAWRARRRGFDLVEAALLVLLTAQALASQRFLGTYALAAGMFVSRDLSGWLARRGRPARFPLRARAACTAAACLAVGPLEWSRWDLPLGFGMEHASYVIRAADFMEAHGVRGRGFNTFGMAGYQVFRFWPDRGRLPFVDIHLSAPPGDRELYARAQVDSSAWRALDAKYHFDYALLARVQYGGDRLLNTLDRDPAFALVFKDDAAALFVRRAGPLAGVAERFAYRVVPAGNAGLGTLGLAVARDPGLRAPVRAELEREVEGSPWHGYAFSLLANLALLEADWPAARALLDSVRVIDPRRPRLFERLGLLDLVGDRPRDALRNFAREAEIHGASAELDVAGARAWAAMGRLDRARAACRRALARDPGFAEAADSLAAWERRGR